MATLRICFCGRTAQDAILGVWLVKESKILLYDQHPYMTTLELEIKPVPFISMSKVQIINLDCLGCLVGFLCQLQAMDSMTSEIIPS